MSPIWLFAVLGCGPVETPDDTATALVDPLTHDVGAEGPFNAGYRSWPLTYTLPTGESREVGFNVWYPTEDESGDEVSYAGLWPDSSGSLGNASLAPVGWANGYPVMIYTHGDQAWGASSADLMAWFASHGWIAVAPDHTGNLFWDNVTPTPHAHWYHRPLDLTATLDELESAESAESAELSGVADTSRVLVTGHSRGGYSVWALMGQSYTEAGVDDSCPDCTTEERDLFLGGFGDERAVAAVLLDGNIRRSWNGPDGHTGALGPVMYQSTDEDHDGRQSVYDGMHSIDYTWVEVEGACHQTFATGVCGSLDTDTGFTIVNTYALSMGRKHVVGDDDARVGALLDGTEVLDGVSFNRRTE